MREADCLIDHDPLDASQLPGESAISAVSLAELAAGPHATEDRDEQARRQDRLQWAATTWDALPFDSESARAYGRVYAAAKQGGRSSRSRPADLMIAATAAANDLPVYTRNPDDFGELGSVVRIVPV